MKSIPDFAPGGQIRICAGSLVDLTGIVVGFTSEADCVLKIDGLATGVYVVSPFVGLQAARNDDEVAQPT